MLSKLCLLITPIVLWMQPPDGLTATETSSEVISSAHAPPATQSDPKRDSQPDSQPATQPDGPTTSADESSTRTASDPQVDALLDELEAGVNNLRNFTADLVYEKVDALLGRSEIRTGRVLYQAKPEANTKRFAILLEQLVVGNRLEEHRKHYVFDGQWLAEINHEEKQFIKRQIVAPGESFDPLKLGEGPFPMPIGQPKQQVLKRFEVKTFDPPGDGPLARVVKQFETRGLVLTPKPGTPTAEAYQRIELLYDENSLLPVGVRAIEHNENEKIVRLSEVKRNSELSDDELAKLDITTPDPKQWAIDIQRWKGR